MPIVHSQAILNFSLRRQHTQFIRAATPNHQGRTYSLRVNMPKDLPIPCASHSFRNAAMPSRLHYTVCGNSRQSRPSRSAPPLPFSGGSSSLAAATVEWLPLRQPLSGKRIVAVLAPLLKENMPYPDRHSSRNPSYPMPSPSPRAPGPLSPPQSSNPDDKLPRIVHVQPTPNAGS